MATKAIGFYPEIKTSSLARGESETKRITVYDTRSRNGHTQAKVFRDGALVWVDLPTDADPQHTKACSLVMASTF